MSAVTEKRALENMYACKKGAQSVAMQVFQVTARRASTPKEE